MKVTPTAIADVLVIEPTIHGDERGHFFEAFNQQRFSEASGCHKSFVQDNQSRSSQGVLRGLHYQLGDNAQDKLVRVLQGQIFDVAVDIRRSSPTYGRWVGETLSAENKKQLWVPVGFAHAFLVTSDTADVLYKVTAPYDPSAERSLIWNDQDLAIAWPMQGEPVVAAKDAAAATFANAEVFA
ncbi:MAG: dTDP-4-dehydrorhamnose 3,5-epimerase [Oceanococcus sp.]